MKKIIISAIMGLMAVCGMAQEKVYVHSDGIAYPFDINKVTEINFIQGSDILAEEPLVITGDVVEVGAAQATIAAKAVVSSLSADYRVGILYCEEKDYVASNFVYSKYDDHKDADWVSAEYSVVLNSLSAETKYYYRAYAYNGEKNLYGEVKTFTTNELILTEGDWIDLGLSVKWASFNLGATSPEMVGDYYAWGEVDTKSDYSSSTSKHYGVEGPNNISGVDGMDAARTILGTGKRTPTAAEFQELCENCNINRIVYKGVRGYYIQSKINSKSIFLPMGGGMYGESIIYDDSGAYYWSATRSSNEYAYRLYTYFDMIDPQNTDPIYIGFPIRPVEDLTTKESVTLVQLYENGPKWANMNIGATSVTDAGLYFWWGDTEGHAKDEEPKFNFSSDNTAIGSYSNKVDYVSDGKLVAEKDAATQLWGATYRMPTSADFEDLANYCDWSWQENYNGVEGANGYLVTGRGNYSDNYIFIPAAGCRDGNELKFDGMFGYYWSSTIYTNAACAYDLFFIQGGGINPTGGFPFYNGYTVRPVSE